MLMIAPFTPFAIQCLHTTLVGTIRPATRLSFSTNSNWAMSVSTNGVLPRLPPAVFTSTSSPPKRFSVAAMAASTDASVIASTTTPSIRSAAPVSFASRAFASSTAFWSMSHSETFAPAFRKASAMPPASTPPPPVSTTVRPVNPNIPST